ncbi:MAG: hypothetical protein WDN06_23015 [Asticcacaulis sp.]
MSDPADINRSGYDRWSDIYDSAVNSTVAVDDMHFPVLWADVRDRDVLEIGCGTGPSYLAAGSPGQPSHRARPVARHAGPSARQAGRFRRPPGRTRYHGRRE